MNFNPASWLKAVQAMTKRQSHTGQTQPGSLQIGRIGKERSLKTARTVIRMLLSPALADGRITRRKPQTKRHHNAQVKKAQAGNRRQGLVHN